MRNVVRTRERTAGLGDRLRTLRLSRGLTQSQLAGDDLTKGFISQVESGRTRLSLRAAQIVAGRLGVPISDVLGETAAGERTAHAQLLEAEHELATGSPEAALRLSKQLRSSAAYRPRVLRLQGRALLALDRAQEAITTLREAQRELRARGQLDLGARTAFDMAVAHARLDEPEEALLNALECERALASGEIIDQSLELRLRAFLAALQVRRGDAHAADLQIDRALKLATDISNRDAQATLYASLARTEQDRGNVEAAIAYWQRSLAELDWLGREHGVAESWLNLALAYLERGDRSDAQVALNRADEMARTLGHTQLRPWVLIGRARLAMMEGHPEAADALVSEVVKASDVSPRARAEALLVWANALTRRGASNIEIRRAYETALAAADREPAGTRARILRDYADALEAAGDMRGSLQRLREALDLYRPGHKHKRGAT